MTDHDGQRIDAGQQHIDGFIVDIDINVSVPQVDAVTLEKVSALLSRLGAIHDRVRRTIIRDFATLPLLKDYLVPGLFELEEQYRVSLFPNAAGAEAVGPDAFLDALTMCRVGYYDRLDVPEMGTCEALVVDYRFLVPHLTPADMERQDMFLQFQGRYDITNQVVTARIAMDGEVIELSVES